MEKRAWVLKIKDVKESDRGWYMCQINTDPMKSQTVFLNVVGKEMSFLVLFLLKQWYGDKNFVTCSASRYLRLPHKY